jgi:hypothetical protein
MHIKTKKLAFLGLLLALTVLAIVLSSYIEMSTFFFLAAASFLVGVAINETSLSLGIGFYLASVFLSLILAPNKLYCLTFAMIAAYLVIVESIRNQLIKQEMKKLATLNSVQQKVKNKRLVLWGAKVIVFNMFYIPMLVFFPKLIYTGKLSILLILGLWVGGQFVLVIYDLAYQEFIIKYWRKIRKNIV